MYAFNIGYCDILVVLGPLLFIICGLWSWFILFVTAHSFFVHSYMVNVVYLYPVYPANIWSTLFNRYPMHLANTRWTLFYRYPMHLANTWSTLFYRYPMHLANTIYSCFTVARYALQIYSFTTFFTGFYCFPMHHENTCSTLFYRYTICLTNTWGPVFFLLLVARCPALLQMQD